MVQFCSAIGCTNERKPGGSVKFHRFPMKNPEVLKLWVRAVRRENFIPNVHTVICSDHFTVNDYLESSKNGNLLKKAAVPSVFNFEEVPKSRCTLKRLKLDSGTMEKNGNEPMECISDYNGLLKKEMGVQTCLLGEKSTQTSF